jgi:hypothetical protein
MYHSGTGSASFVVKIVEGYKNVLTDGPPREDGGYLVVLEGDEQSVPQLFIRFTQKDGSRVWVSADHKKIEEQRILLYKRILITPDGIKPAN